MLVDGVFVATGQAHELPERDTPALSCEQLEGVAYLLPSILAPAFVAFAEVVRRPDPPGRFVQGY
jgi:hypothetical protein